VGVGLTILVGDILDWAYVKSTYYMILIASLHTRFLGARGSKLSVEKLNCPIQFDYWRP